MDYKARFKAYCNLTKPGIIYGNLLNAVAGFLLACRWHIDFVLLIKIILGISLTIASACVFNNYIDRDIDAKMARTRKRALVQHTISENSALIYAITLGLAGFIILFFINTITLVLGLIGFIDYVILYGFSKRKISAGTLIGSISGALPPASGYTAVTGRFDLTALLLFIILICWQMPHFYAISLYRYKDYKAAGIPVLPVAKTPSLAKKRILIYVGAYILSLTALKAHATKLGYIYLVIALAPALYWFGYGIKKWNAVDDQAWGRSMFLRSLIVILGFSAAIAIGPLLP